MGAKGGGGRSLQVLALLVSWIRFSVVLTADFSLRARHPSRLRSYCPGARAARGHGRAIRYTLASRTLVGPVAAYEGRRRMPPSCARPARGQGCGIAQTLAIGSPDGPRTQERRRRILCSRSMRCSPERTPPTLLHLRLRYDSHLCACRHRPPDCLAQRLRPFAHVCKHGR